MLFRMRKLKARMKKIDEVKVAYTKRLDKQSHTAAMGVDMMKKSHENMLTAERQGRKMQYNYYKGMRDALRWYFREDKI